MKKWFYRNVVLLYVLATASVIIGALYCIQQRVSEETFDALFSIALIVIFMVVVSAVFIGIWGENKQKEMYIDSLQEEPVSEELEFASEKYACRFTSSKYGHDKIKATFKAGAKWQKEQMMKDAIGREVAEGSMCPAIETLPVLTHTDMILLPKDKFKSGDKVKIIIIKEE